MGYRFRKSFRFGPFRINLSKSGVGYSVGNKFVRYTKKANGGTRVTTTLPGTGISHVSETGARAAKTAPSEACGATAPAPAPNNAERKPVNPLVIAGIVVVLVLAAFPSAVKDHTEKPAATAEQPVIEDEPEPIDFTPIEACFSSVYPDAVLSHLNNSGTPQIMVTIAEYSAEAQPQGWDDVQETFESCLQNADTAAKEAGYQTAMGQLLSKDGTILLSGFRGKLRYNAFAAEEPVIQSSGSTIVFVSPTGSRYHRSNTCSSGNYTATTLDNALARGLSACKKCA